jgi:rSAM/selenodomain-associated transferase 2/rSAM/selenodomain-associated transferase 1
MGTNVTKHITLRAPRSKSFWDSKTLFTKRVLVAEGIDNKTIIIYNSVVEGRKIKVSVIIPVFKEEAIINRAVGSLMNSPGAKPAEIIVVDGDGDSTVRCIENNDAIKLSAPKGRAVQMNRGAKEASGDILLFLHADTMLPPNGMEKIIEVMSSNKYAAGAFNYAIQSRRPFLRFIYYTSYLRSRVSRIAYGDQAIFIQKDYFEKIGSFPVIPLMEDVELMKRIKKNRDKICILKEGVITSTRRYDKEGLIYGWLRNHRLRILYFFGVSAERLAGLYPDTREEKEGLCLRRPFGESLFEKSSAKTFAGPSGGASLCGFVLFLKFPLLGAVKTRLAKELGDAFALELYECFVRDMLEKLTWLRKDFDVCLFLAPPGKASDMRDWLGGSCDWPVHDQEGRDLGERMKHTFEQMFQLGYKSCVLLGCDFPDLPVSVLQEAAKRLQSTEAVIAPTKDGGYYLVGFQNDHFCAAIFDSRRVQWSTEQVFQQTLSILRESKNRHEILQQWQDVDNLDDLKNLLERNADSDFKESHTIKFLLKKKSGICSHG